jgi:flagellar hook protein FlgE
MGLHQSLYTGVTGLNSNTDGMNVIANNIANANTRAFKTDRAEFEDLMSQSLSENATMGRGSRLRNITTSFTQGALSPTGGITDLAIQGDGFFVVKNDNHEVKESNAMFYTRQGSFNFNRNGFLSDAVGGKVMGYMADGFGNLSSKLTPVQISTATVPPVATSMATVAANLDIRERPPRDEFDVARPSQTSNFSSTVPIFDTLGQTHLCTVYFVRERTDEGENKWKYFATMDGKDIKGAKGADENGNPLATVVAEGNIEFDSDGKLKLPFRTKDGYPTFTDFLEKSDAIEIEWSNGSKPQKMQFNFGPNVDEKGSLTSQMCTSIAAKSDTFYHSQNGFEAGNLKSMKIDLDGSVRGVFTNGVERRLFGVALATFSAPTALTKVGRNSFIAPPKAGEPHIGTPQSGNRGSIYAATLEESNVDIAQQFVDMITTQRAFQASSKTVTTADSLLEEIINLRR